MASHTEYAPPREATAAVTFDVAALPRLLTPVTALLLAGHLLTGVVPFLAPSAQDVPGVRTATILLDFGGEANLPTYFSALLLLGCAGVAAMLATASGDRTPRRLWLAAAAALAFLSADEMTQIHERLNNPLRALLGSASDGFLHYAWVLPYGLLSAVVAVLAWRLARLVPSDVRARLLTAAALYVSAALGLEVIEAAVATTAGNDTLTYFALVTVEELTEIVAVALALHTLTVYAARLGLQLHLRAGR